MPTLTINDNNGKNSDKTFVFTTPTTLSNATTEAFDVVLKGNNSLTIGKGQTLAIGNSLVFEDEQSQVVVETGGILTVGKQGIIAANAANIVIKSNADGTGAVLLHPEVLINIHPAATIEMYTKAHKEGDKWYSQHFAIPMNAAPATLSRDNKSVNTWLAKWANNGWKNLSDVSELSTPFQGYALTNDASAEGVIYTFTGNIVGNGNAPMQFMENGYNMLGNSYVAPMDITDMLAQFQTTIGDKIDYNIWIYQSKNDRHLAITKNEIEKGDADMQTIAPMQGFIMRLGEGETASADINYETAVWNNINKTGIAIQAPARFTADEVVAASIVISANGSSDKVKLYEGTEYAADFDNGADARKYMDNGVFNFYADAQDMSLSVVATDNLEGTTLSLQADANMEYTMSFERVRNMDYAVLDTQTGKAVIIEEGQTYSFIVPANTTAANRFRIINRQNVTTDVETIQTTTAQGIYTITGQYLGETTIWSTLPQGIYTVNGEKLAK